MDDGFSDARRGLLPVLRAQARVLAGSRDAADDLVHEAVLRMLRPGTRRPPTEELRPWAFVVLRNAWRSELRRRRTARRALAAHAAEPQAGCEAAPEAEPGLRRRLAAALAELPAAQREALAICGMEPTRVQEVAALCGIAPGTLRARASRARAALRARLAP